MKNQNENENLGLKLKEDAGMHPRLNQCYLCKAWQLEANLQAIEIPSQGTEYVQKLACRECMDKILKEEV